HASPPLFGVQIAHNGGANDSACRCAGTNRLPEKASGAAAVSPGSAGAAPLPLPALPPEFIRTCGPTIDIPLGSILTKLPPALKVISLPDSRTTFMPLDRWIS